MTTTGMGQGTGDYQGLYEGLKVVFEDPIGDSTVQDTELIDLWEHDAAPPMHETGGGRYIELSHYTADGGGFGARREGGALPEATPPSIFLGRINIRKNHMTVEMSGDTMRRMSQGPEAWLTWAKEALPKATRRFNHHQDRQIIGYGQGCVGKVTAVTAVGGGAYVAGAAATITIGHNLGITNKPGAIFNLLKNDLVRFAADINGVTLRGAARSQITAIDPKLGTFNVDVGPAGLVVGDFITPGDTADNSLPGGVSASPKEFMGLYGLVDDGSVLATFQNQVRASTPEYCAQVIDASTQTVNASKLTEDLLIYADDVAFQFGSGTPDVLVGSRAQERQYWRNLKSSASVSTIGDRKTVINAGGKPRGFEILVNGRPINFRVSRKMPDTDVFFWEKATMKKWQNGNGFHFDNTTGTLWERVVSGSARYDAFYAVGVSEREFGCLAPNHNVRIKGIDVTLA